MGAKKYCSRDCAFDHRRNENHFAWKGKEASYSAIHKWVSTNFKKNKECFNCGGDKPRLEWANISRYYKRDISDWIVLCSSCHKYFDVNAEKRSMILSRWEKYSGKKAQLDGPDSL